MISHERWRKVKYTESQAVGKKVWERKLGGGGAACTKTRCLPVKELFNADPLSNISLYICVLI